MKHKRLIYVCGFAIIFFFLPSLGFKLWNLLWEVPTEMKLFICYGLVGWVLLWWGRRRMQRYKAFREVSGDQLPLCIAKRRLATGEISLDEFRQIKQELD